MRLVTAVRIRYFQCDPVSPQHQGPRPSLVIGERNFVNSRYIEHDLSIAQIGSHVENPTASIALSWPGHNQGIHTFQSGLANDGQRTFLNTCIVTAHDRKIDQPPRIRCLWQRAPRYACVLTSFGVKFALKA